MGSDSESSNFDDRESQRTKKRGSLHEKKRMRKKAKLQTSREKHEYGALGKFLHEQHTITKKQASYLQHDCIGLLRALRARTIFWKILHCIHQGTMSNLYMAVLRKCKPKQFSASSSSSCSSSSLSSSSVDLSGQVNKSLENDNTVDDHDAEETGGHAVLKIFHKNLKNKKTEIEQIKKANDSVKYTSKKEAFFWAENESRMMKLVNQKPHKDFNCARLLARFHNALLFDVLHGDDPASEAECDVEERRQNADETLKPAKAFRLAPNLAQVARRSATQVEPPQNLKVLVREAISYLVQELSLFVPSLSAYSLLLRQKPSGLYIVDFSRARLINCAVEKRSIFSHLESKVLGQVC